MSDHKEIPVPTEDEEQEALFQWAILREQYIPELRLLFAIPNGGYRHPATAARMARTGVRAGVPDMLLPVAREGWNGLFIELKRRKGGVVSANQKEWIRRLTEQGYKVAICKGWEEAKDEIEGYLGREGRRRTAACMLSMTCGKGIRLWREC